MNQKYFYINRSSETGGMVCTTVGNHHRKSNSLDAGMGKQTKQQPSRERYEIFKLHLHDCTLYLY